jgi:hypothetical protein
MANCNTKYNNDKPKSITEHFEMSTGGVVGITIASVIAIIGVLLFVKFVLMK